MKQKYITSSISFLIISFFFQAFLNAQNNDCQTCENLGMATQQVININNSDFSQNVDPVDPLPSGKNKPWFTLGGDFNIVSTQQQRSGNMSTIRSDASTYLPIWTGTGHGGPGDNFLIYQHTSGNITADRLIWYQDINSNAFTHYSLCFFARRLNQNEPEVPRITVKVRRFPSGIEQTISTFTIDNTDWEAFNCTFFSYSSTHFLVMIEGEQTITNPNGFDANAIRLPNPVGTGIDDITLTECSGWPQRCEQCENGQNLVLNPSFDIGNASNQDINPPYGYDINSFNFVTNWTNTGIINNPDIYISDRTDADWQNNPDPYGRPYIFTGNDLEVSWNPADRQMWMRSPILSVSSFDGRTHAGFNSGYQQVDQISPEHTDFNEFFNEALIGDITPTVPNTQYTLRLNMALGTRGNGSPNLASWNLFQPCDDEHGFVSVYLTNINNINANYPDHNVTNEFTVFNSIADAQLIGNFIVVDYNWSEFTANITADDAYNCIVITGNRQTGVNNCTRNTLVDCVTLCGEPPPQFECNRNSPLFWSGVLTYTPVPNGTPVFNISTPNTVVGENYCIYVEGIYRAHRVTGDPLTDRWTTENMDGAFIYERFNGNILSGVTYPEFQGLPTQSNLILVTTAYNPSTGHPYWYTFTGDGNPIQFIYNPPDDYRAWLLGELHIFIYSNP